MSQATQLTDAVDAALTRSAMLPPGPARPAVQLRQLAHRCTLVLANSLSARMGERIPAGPFAGMAYPVPAAEGGRAPRRPCRHQPSLLPVWEWRSSPTLWLWMERR